jgi:hypothetical protein
MLASTSLLLGAALVMAGPPGRPGSEAAEPPEAETETPAEGVSPVELIPRIELRHTSVQASSGAAVSTTTLELDIVLLRRVLFRYELPRQVLRVGDDQISGLGDIRLQAIALLTSGPRQVSVLIAGVELDTATRPQLGAGKQQVFFGGAAAFKPRLWWMAYGVLREQLSVAGDDAREEVNHLVLRVGNILFGPGRAWCKLDLDGMLDFHEDRRRLFGTLEVGSLLIGRVGLFVRSGTQLAGQRQLDYSLEAGLRYLFRLGPPR